MAVDYADQLFAAPRLAVWHRKIVEEVADTSILIAGDSTGAEASPIRWPRILTNKIAAQWPRQTVIYHPWDDATKTYPAGSAVTVQTGASGRTIHIYNCSVSGQVVGYVMTNVGTITAGIVDPDVVIWNYGHNSPQDLSNYRGLTHQAVNLVGSKYPNAATIITAQNPRASITTGVTLAADYAPDQLRQRANFEYAMAEGDGCVDVNSVFRAYGDYNADLLADGLHPNAAGSELWATQAWLTIQPKAGLASTSAAASRTQRIWVPAKAFDALDGSPSYGAYFGLGGWALDADAEESIAAIIDYPADWALVNVDVFFVCPTAPNVSARTVALLTSHMYVGGDASGVSGSSVLGTWTANAAGNVSGVLSTTLGSSQATTIYNRVGFSKRPLGLKIARKAGDAADTLPQDLIIYGAMIQRMY